MFHFLFQRFMNLRNRNCKPRIFSSSNYGFSKNDFPLNVLEIIRTLHENGHKAFVVGGAVRDLLINKVPKDFDIATSAHPEDVVKLFHRAKIIGRRFRIVLVYSRRDYVEVTTFRGRNLETKHKDSFGRILEDNLYGTQFEDAKRRDFTINAIYYNPFSEELIDYSGGIFDISKRVIRMLGDPNERFREDPVRILRAIRFSKKLSFSLDDSLVDAIHGHSSLLNNVPAARLFDELIKILLSGHSLSSIHEFKRLGINDRTIPLLNLVYDHIDDPFVQISLEKTDHRVSKGQSVSVIFLFATLLWPLIRKGWYDHRVSGIAQHHALLKAMSEVTQSIIRDYDLPKRILVSVREIWMMQSRFENTSVSRATRFISHTRFRLGYDFMLLRTEAGEVNSEISFWWKNFLSDSPSRLSRRTPHRGKKAQY
ncbi:MULTISPECIES: polynucleotide adenylyltransferase PcnB [Candidatus Ichthyocystis]|uniref:Poly(A) polymerase I n=1 Tax=Candidatus Ichthyocystis hellenicum TaxID=1561003 RepID=A0A0S4M6Y8_9BURK|nr:MULTISPECIES: polynucleotide adenylyltransferase PcnB [Ichthyocystis]CUT18038.1 Poly(A) polymerase [Candidatus Ichthyocystis hellenicum]